MHIYFIGVEAYVKTNFAETYDNKLNKLIGCDSITDGIYIVEVHIIDFTNNDYMDLQILKGDKIEIIGIIQATGILY